MGARAARTGGSQLPASKSVGQATQRWRKAKQQSGIQRSCRAGARQLPNV